MVGVVNIITRKVHSHHFDCQCFISLVRSIVRKKSGTGEEEYQAYKYVESREDHRENGAKSCYLYNF